MDTFAEFERFSITPLGTGDHVFSLDDHGLVSRHDPPALASGPVPSIYTRDDDGLGIGYDSGDVHVLTHRDAASGRPTDLVLAEGTLTLGYDATSGKLSDLSMPNTAGAVATHFLRDGPLLLSESWSGGVVGMVTRGYDTLGRVSSVTVDATPAITLGRDRDGLLMSAGPLSFTRDAASGLPSTLSVGGVSTSFGFDGFGALTSRSTTWAGGRFDVGVDYDRAGQAAGWRETGAAFARDWSFDHDDAGRLTEVYEDGAATPTWHYAYDAAGHRIGWSTPEGSCVAPGCVDIDAQDRLLRQGAVSYGYDAAGRRTSRTDAAGTTMYGYGSLGHLRSATLASAHSTNSLILW
ncbi:MAG: RHS repeat protein [Deltaproteobacteria bacterium]|nr:RHS repeat protein [Deltaproteobacteria bacterium]